MKKQLLALTAMAAMFGDECLKSYPGVKNKPHRIKKNIPPRSMTPAEKEYYAIHKNLNHFKEPA